MKKKNLNMANMGLNDLHNLGLKYGEEIFGKITNHFDFKNIHDFNAFKNGLIHELTNNSDFKPPNHK